MQGSGVKTAEAYRPDGLAGLVPLSDAGDSPPKKPRRKDTGREGVGFTACTETGPQSWKHFKALDVECLVRPVQAWRTPGRDVGGDPHDPDGRGDSVSAVREGKSPSGHSRQGVSLLPP